jgi:hypothetical protein
MNSNCGFINLFSSLQLQQFLAVAKIVRVSGAGLQKTAPKLHQNCTGERFLHRWNSGEPFFGWGTIFAPVEFWGTILWLGNHFLAR